MLVKRWKLEYRNYHVIHVYCTLTNSISTAIEHFVLHASTTDGKIYPKWMFRNNEKDPIKDYVHEQLFSLMREELNEVKEKLRKKSGTSYNLDSEGEGDDIDRDFALIDWKKYSKKKSITTSADGNE